MEESRVETLRSFAYGTSLGPFPVVVWFGFATLVLFAMTAGVAGLKKQIPLFRHVPVRVHRMMAIIGLIIGLFHLVLALSIYV
jgi:hypothetical protein